MSDYLRSIRRGNPISAAEFMANCSVRELDHTDAKNVNRRLLAALAQLQNNWQSRLDKLCREVGI